MTTPDARYRATPSGAPGYGADSRRDSTIGRRHVTAVVPIHNGGHLLGECVDALLASCLPADANLKLDVVMIDDASTDASVEVARRCAAASAGRIRLVELGRNHGFSGAVNRAIRSRLGSAPVPDMLVLVNQDCVVRTGWLEPLVAALENPDVAVAGARLMDADGTTLQHAGARIEPNGLTTHYGRGSRDPRAWRDDCDADYVCGALMAMRTETWRTFGPFDEGYFPAYFEEVDFCVRARRAGKRVVYVAASEARHVEASASGRGSALFLRRYHRSRMRFVVRNLFGGRATIRWVFSELSWIVRLRRWSEIAPVIAAWASIPALLAERAHVRIGRRALRVTPAPLPVEMDMGS